MSPIEELKDIVYGGIFNDISLANEANYLLRLLSANIERLNEYGDFFGPIWNQLVEVCVIHICKIYERKNNRYPIRSIPSALYILETDIKNIQIKDRDEFIPVYSSFIKLNVDPQVLSDEDLTGNVINYFNDTLKKHENEITRIKERRDKFIAHNERLYSPLPDSYWKDITTLLDLAKKFICLVGLGYLGHHYQKDGKYTWINDEEKIKSSFEKLLAKLS
jgi:hypothetical protein